MLESILHFFAVFAGVSLVIAIIVTVLIVAFAVFIFKKAVSLFNGSDSEDFGDYE